VTTSKGLRPVAPRVNGKAQLLVQDGASYQGLLEQVEHAGAIAAVKKRLSGVAAGQIRPAREALEGLARKHQRKPAKGE
jgi:hypothetical protein